ncbi:MAG: B12-binding domain-containing radical SAM protein [Candidatus Sumerlaeaceae bacterium]|nr:B12-binding domain-containing radical SAM protein [Candidatus Sumerlaeaceae bacterium]
MVAFQHRQRIEALLQAERGCFRKPFGSGHTAGVVFPNSYHVGMSNLGFLYLHRLINARRDWMADRFFVDFDPPLSLENIRAPGDYQLLFFSIAFELDYLNILDFLARARFPLRASERGSEYPLIVCGGVCVDVNRHPIYEFADVIVNAEAEAILDEFLSLFEEYGGDRRRFLDAIRSMEGVEVTAGACQRYHLELPAITDYRVPLTERVISHDFWRYPCFAHIVTPNTEFGDMCLVELARGCPYRCTFCFVGHNLNPYRTVPLDELKRWITEQQSRTCKFGFVASAVASHPQIDELCEFCDQLGVKVSYSSLRAEDVTVPMIRTLARSGIQTLTLAPEAGTYRLRRLLGKARLPDERLFWVIEQALAFGIPNLKLYFMVGLPTETEEDVLGIVDLVSRLQREFVASSRTRGRIGALSLNIGIFVPIPKTPLAKFLPLAPDQIRLHVRLLERQLRKLHNVRFSLPSLTLAQVQQLLVQGDLRVSEFLMFAQRYGGNWRQALREWENRVGIPC